MILLINQLFFLLFNMYPRRARSRSKTTGFAREGGNVHAYVPLPSMNSQQRVNMYKNKVTINAFDNRCSAGAVGGIASSLPIQRAKSVSQLTSQNTNNNKDQFSILYQNITEQKKLVEEIDYHYRINLPKRNEIVQLVTENLKKFADIVQRRLT
ncbi:hypothetical protein Mgra_00001397 [Meloidogyne graminicola]|uniref:Uncharacterized protein n=1 Tax=Meloidogyne graminicola TaxID=189291 RepID=A0A8S9ZZG2_9BILA|nr:hypothetical protein Mgra_00001397 [Meloidogyne graminicola]